MMNKILSKQTEIVILLITLLLIHTWWFPGFSKLLEMQGEFPSWFTQMYTGTFLETFPGLTLSYWCIAICEALACLFAVLSLVLLEFWRGNHLFLRGSLIFSLFNFLVLGFGLSLVKNNDGATKLYVYFALTIVLLNYVTNAFSRNRS